MSIPNYHDKNAYPDSKYLCPQCQDPLIQINDTIYRCRKSDWHGIYEEKEAGT